MEEIKINIYDDNFENVIKTQTAQMAVVSFGTVRKLMRLFNYEQMNTTEVLEAVLNSWDDVIGLLGRIFPEMTEEDWDHVDTGEVLRVIVAILKKSISTFNKIPKDPN